MIKGEALGKGNQGWKVTNKICVTGCTAKDTVWDSPPYCSESEASPATGLTGGTASRKTDCSQTVRERLIAKAELYENEGNQIPTFQTIEPGNTMVTLHHANKKTQGLDNQRSDHL